ncbi:hypothetical protein Tco_0008805 [Tanacetum coccineum]
MDANKKIDLINLQCSNESKILGDILNNHPLQLSLAGSASVPWIYIQQFWHSLKLDDSKDKFKFFVDTKEFTFSVDDIRRIFQLPQATDNNNVGFVAAPSFSHMLLFFHNDLCNPDIPRRLHEHYHRVENDEVVKSIFNSGKNKEGGGRLISEWMLTKEMKLTAHSFSDVYIGAPRTPNPDTTQGESSTPRKPTVIRFRLRSQPDLEKPIPTSAEIDIDSLDEATRLSIAIQ